MQAVYDSVQVCELDQGDNISYDGNIYTVTSIDEDLNDCIIITAFSLTTGFHDELIFEPFDYVSLVEITLED